jgi:small subunit ribosomal protein S17
VSNEEAVTGEVTDDTQAATASAPAAASTQGQPGVASASEPPGSERRRARRKVREGVVVSNGMDKTAVVAVIERVRHPKYNKTVLQTTKLYAHDEANDVNVGDRVRVMETRPLSKTKRWRVTDVLERAR